MASFNMELRKVCDFFTRKEVENWFKNYKLSDYLTEEQIKTITSTGLWSKENLAKKIVDHYFMREIGSDTPALFKHFAKVEMQEIMEYYLPIIYSNAIKYDVLVNVDYKETFSRKIEGTAENLGTSKSNSQNEGSSLVVNSDTPQGKISKSSILQGDYATNTGANETESNINNTTNSNASSSSSTTESYTKQQKGNSGSLTTSQKLIEQYRNIIYAVDQEIIKKLNILFMGIF